MAEKDGVQRRKGGADAGPSTAHLERRLGEDAGVLRDWLFEFALPLWWSAGADHANGGFQELLDRNGSPVVAPRRVRVQTRQIYVYATVGVLGWPGPWRDAVTHGLDYLIERYWRSDDLVRALVTPMGAAADDGPLLYDQAFGLLALAAADAATDGAAGTAGRARALMVAIESRFGHPGGGYRSGDAERSFQSNPNMHLFEASLAWMARDPSSRWSDLAARLADLAMTRFVDPFTGALREFFDEEWSPASGTDGTRIEPGHQFEWAWLLNRWGRLTGNPAAIGVADRLYDIGADEGVDRGRNVAVDALGAGFTVLDASARLWPQTERIKAALSAAASRPDRRNRHLSEAIDAVGGLSRYLLPNGTWRDSMTAEGVFVEQPAPATSLYHIVGAITELVAFAERRA